VSRQWFVKPDTVKLELEDDEWIEVKKELNYGEQSKLIVDSQVKVGMDGIGEVNPMNTAIPGIMAYVVDWSVEVDGKRQEITREVLEAMPFDYVLEIGAAINEHTGKMAEEKKANSGKGTKKKSKAS
jgi:hypothetical protein